MNKTNFRQRGVVLVGVLILTGTLTVLIAAMLSSGITAKKSVATWRTSDQNLFKAQSVMSQVKYNLYTQFKTYFNAAPAAKLSSKFSWFDTWSSTSVGSSGAYTLPNNFDAGDGYRATAAVAFGFASTASTSCWKLSSRD